MGLGMNKQELNALHLRRFEKKEKKKSISIFLNVPFQLITQLISAWILILIYTINMMQVLCRADI